MKLTGTWVGEYTFGDGYDDAGAAGQSVPFTMSLTESWLRRVIGYVRDDASRGGQPERGRVGGRRRGDRFEFVKTMPVGYQMTEDGPVETRQYLERELEIELPDELPPHRVHYAGTLDPDRQCLAGEWVILPWQIGDRAGGGGRGTWTARRTSDQPSEV